MSRSYRHMLFGPVCKGPDLHTDNFLSSRIRCSIFDKFHSFRRWKYLSILLLRSSKNLHHSRLHNSFFLFRSRRMAAHNLSRNR